MENIIETTPTWRLDWDESLSVFIPEIDNEHKRFIRLVNELNEGIVDRLDTAVLQKRLQYILDDAAEHFAHEEALFKTLHYPNAGEHTLKHAAIVQTLNDTMDQLSTGTTSYEWVAAGLKIKALLIPRFLSRIGQSVQGHDLNVQSMDRSGQCSVLLPKPLIYV